MPILEQFLRQRHVFLAANKKKIIAYWLPSSSRDEWGTSILDMTHGFPSQMPQKLILSVEAHVTEVATHMDW